MVSKEWRKEIVENMKIIQTLSSIGYASAGPSYSVPNLCRGLELAGADVELCTREPAPNRAVPCRISYYKCDRTWLPKLGSSKALRNGLLEKCRDADILHANALWMMSNVYPGWVRKHCPNLKLVWSPRGAMAQWTLNKNKLLKKVFGTLFQWPAVRQTDMFHATSIKEYEEIRELGFTQPIAVIPIGMDIPCVKKEISSRKSIVFFGRLHSVKKVDDLILAWNKICDKYPDCELKIAGPDFGVKAELEQLVINLKIPRVSFVGELTGDTKYNFLANATLYVLPSLSENFGITIAEALACGTPVISTYGTPWRGLIEHKCGWWVPNGSDDIATALDEALSLPMPVLENMGQNGVDWIKNEFSWPSVGTRMLQSYTWLISGGDKPEWIRLYNEKG